MKERVCMCCGRSYPAETMLYCRACGTTYCERCAKKLRAAECANDLTYFD